MFLLLAHKNGSQRRWNEDNTLEISSYDSKRKQVGERKEGEPTEKLKNYHHYYQHDDNDSLLSSSFSFKISVTTDISEGKEQHFQTYKSGQCYQTSYRTFVIESDFHFSN